MGEMTHGNIIISTTYIPRIAASQDESREFSRFVHETDGEIAI